MSYPSRHFTKHDLWFRIALVVCTVGTLFLLSSKAHTATLLKTYSVSEPYSIIWQNGAPQKTTMKNKRRTSKPRKTSSSARPLPIPIPSRSDALVTDSLRNENRVEIFTDVGSERGVVRVTLRESQTVEIVAFNILGKRVAEVYAGEAKAGMNTVGFDLSNLSNGVYICVVRGRNFKTAEKFIVSR